MAKVVGNLVTAPGGTVYVAPVGSTAPANEAAALDAAWKDLGYVTPEGVAFRVSHEEAVTMAWQAQYAIKRKITGRAAQLSFTLLEWNTLTLDLLVGGGVVTTIASGHTKLTPPVAGTTQDERACLVEWSEGSNLYRIVIPKVAIDPGQRELVLRRTDDAVLPVTLNINATDTADAYYLLTNNTAIVP